MRKTKLITVEGQGEVIIREVSPMAVYRAWAAGKDRIGELRGLVDECVTPGFSKISEWYPSEIEQVVTAFIEVNNSFFVIARHLKIDGLVTEMASAMAKNLPAVFADSFALAMQEHGTTDGKHS